MAVKINHEICERFLPLKFPAIVWEKSGNIEFKYK